VEKIWCQHHITILAALALLNTDHHLGAVDIADLERHHFAGTQAAAIGEAQQQAALEARRGIEQAPHFLGTEHDRDLLRFGDVLDLVGDLRPSQRHPQQEGHARHRAVARADAHCLLGQMQLKEPDILGARRVR